MSLAHAVALITDRIVEPVQGMHHAISSRWFKAIGPIARPVQIAHDAISKAAYGSVRIGGATAGHALAATADEESRAADRVQAVTNGLWGDDLGSYEQHLAIRMKLHHPQPTTWSPATDTESSSPAPTGRIVILVHGLFETEDIWQQTPPQRGMVDRLFDEPLVTPLSIRYNSGLPIAENGAQLARLIETFTSAWPVPLESIALVGHSLGGLVIRSACSSAQLENYAWLKTVTDVVTLGTPHQGSPIEKFVNAATWGLGFAQTTQPLAAFLRSRSAGIKGTRFGDTGRHEQANPGPNPDAHGSAEGQDLPTGIMQHFIAGSITSNPAHPIGKLLGDLVVRPGSAAGMTLSPTTSTTFGNLTHQQLATDPPVLDHIMDIVSTSLRPT